MIQFQFALVADAGHIDSGSGKVSLIGEFSAIFAKALPASASMVVLSRWLADAADVKDREVPLEVELTGPDEKQITRSSKLPLSFEPPSEFVQVEGKRRATILLQVVNQSFPKHGDYAFRFYLDGEPNGSITFSVTPPPKKPQG